VQDEGSPLAPPEGTPRTPAPVGLREAFPLAEVPDEALVKELKRRRLDRQSSYVPSPPPPPPQQQQHHQHVYRQVNAYMA
jgi:hypothetical protein